MAFPIPSPPTLPIIGNMLSIDHRQSVQSFRELAEKYGEIYLFNSIGGQKRIFINTVELFEEVCDESRFCKVIHGALRELREGSGPGLFTAEVDEKHWQIAHRILAPIFSNGSVVNMHDDMYDIASQLVLKCARRGPDHSIIVSREFTRLTFDTLALCTMNYRFNSFYMLDLHPFVDAMNIYMLESGRRAFRPVLMTKLMWKTNAKYASSVKVMTDLAKSILQHRRENPTKKMDILNAMVSGIDPLTKERMDDESIVQNLITMLIAGHETTAGLLSFVFYYLLRNPDLYKRAQQEVDDVVGHNRITASHLPKLEYITAVLRETLRLHPTATFFSVGLRPGIKNCENQTLGHGKYRLDPDIPLVVNLSAVMRDPKVYGDYASEFRPERMMNENFTKLPQGAWKPFGNGVRACLGRPFAWHESLLVTAMLLQFFDSSLVDDYELKITQSLTVKPDERFKIRVRLRPWVDMQGLPAVLVGNMGRL